MFLFNFREGNPANYQLMFLSCRVGWLTFPTFREINPSLMQIAKTSLWHIFSCWESINKYVYKKDSTSDSKPLMLFSLILQDSIIPACSEYLPDHPLAHSHEKLRGTQKRGSAGSWVCSEYFFKGFMTEIFSFGSLAIESFIFRIKVYPKCRRLFVLSLINHPRIPILQKAQRRQGREISINFSSSQNNSKILLPFLFIKKCFLSSWIHK